MKKNMYLRDGIFLTLMEDGAEFLLTLDYPYSLTAITESYESNIRLCEEKLKPLGIYNSTDP